MSKLAWDQVGDRFYEEGVNRGVLYPKDGPAVAWSGLLAVDNDLSESNSNPLYYDGVKIRDDRNYGGFAAKLSALTYPAAFEKIQGTSEVVGGFFVDGQENERFDLSYTTGVGNDTTFLEYGYKIHILYDLVAVVDNKGYGTINNVPVPSSFGWNILGIPQEVDGFRPTGHVIIESNNIDPGLLSEIEDLLYGTNVTSPSLPSISELLAL